MSTSKGASGDPAGGSRDSVTFMLPTAVRVRARETYRRTAHAERDGSWADFLATAIIREVERRERLHNEGRRYPVANERLRPGRGNRRLFGPAGGGT